ncbi:MAG: hypothetical protein WA231_22040 [Methylocella sp.]
MTRAPFLIIDGKLYRWKDILELRRAQLAAARPPSARRRGAICIQVCSNIRPLKQGRAASGKCAAIRVVP